jgi:putative oxidoreductase
MSMSVTPLDGLAERNRDWVLLLARILLAAIFVQSGFGKLTHFAAFAHSMAAKGLPLPILWALAGIATEFFGSLCILFGLATRLIAPLMVVFVAFAAILGHAFWSADAASYQGQYTHFMKNLAIMGGYLALSISGAGGFSLDGWLRRRL